MSTNTFSQRNLPWLLLTAVLFGAWITSLVVPEVFRSVVIEVVRNVVGH